MKSLAVIGAMYFELKPLLRHLDVTHQWKEKETHIFQTQWKEQTIYVVRTGIGKKKAEKGICSLLEKVSPSLVLSTGLCGAIAKTLKVGETFLSEQILDLESGERYAAKAFSQGDWPTGQLVTSNHVLGPEQKEKVLAKYPEAKICDMETSGLANILEKRGIPFISLRTVLDPWDWEFPPEEILMQKNRWRQMKMLYRNGPSRFPVEFFRLLQLGWHAQKGAKTNTKNILRIFSFLVDTKT